MTTPEIKDKRHQMVETQIAGRGIRDREVLEAMRKVPREDFVSPAFKAFAYEDGPLPIGHDQTISQPYIVALMIETARIRPGERVLEIGTGSGYAAAVIAEIGAEIHTIERCAPLGEAARNRLAAAGYDNVTVHIGDGTLGWTEAAPFDAILVAAGGPSVPPTLRAQLKEGGRLVIPVGETATAQDLIRLTRTGRDEWDEEPLASVSFVPLIGAQGWAEDGTRAISSPLPAQVRG